MINEIARKQTSGSCIIIGIGAVGLIGSLFVLFSGMDLNGKSERSVYSILVVSVIMMILGAIGVILWYSKLNKLREAEPGLSDYTLMSCESRVLEMFFFYQDRMIDMRDPKVVYYYNIDGLDVRHSYGYKGRSYFVLIISLRTGDTVRISFSHRGYFTQDQTRAKVEMLYNELRMRCPYMI